MNLLVKNIVVDKSTKLKTNYETTGNVVANVCK